MSSISIESLNEKRLTVEEYVCYLKVRDQIQNILDKSNIREAMLDAENSINGLTIEIIIRYSVNKKRY